MATDSRYRNTRLQKLSGSDYEMVDGEPDIRGWDVKDDAGRTVGEVEELIFDVQSQKIRYLVLDLEDNELDLDDREVLVPIGIAQLDKDDDDVRLPGVTIEQLQALPEYDEDRFDTDSEESVRNVFGGLGAAALAGGSDADFYNHEHFNDANLYKARRGETATDTTIPVIKEELEIGKKEVQTGGIRLRSKIVEQDVSEDLTLRKETVSVDRQSVDRPATGAEFKDLEVEVRERAEVPVVHKEARVVEEVRLSKEVTEHDETVRDTVRSTEVDVDRIDSDKVAQTRTDAGFEDNEARSDFNNNTNRSL